MRSKEERKADLERREAERKSLYAARMAKVSASTVTPLAARQSRPYRPSRLSLLIGALIPGIGQLQRARLGKQYADNWKNRVKR